MRVLSLGTIPEACVRNHKKLIGFVGFIALLLALLEVWSVAAPMRGRTAARFDLWQGHYRILTYGLPVSYFPEYVRLLKERYGIETHPVAGCTVSKDLISYVDGYDGIIARAANHKFGRDVFKECAEDARKTR
jgi:hypothetical protein